MIDLMTHGFGSIVLEVPIWSQYVHFLEHFLDWLARNAGGAGIALILFTIIAKTAILPLTIKSTRSMKAMQEIQPKIKELQKKYGKDRAKMQQEQMRLFRQHGVNPMGGCLPALLQMPIFFGVYQAISHLSRGTGPVNASPTWAEPFLWLPSLAKPDPYYILPILAGVFQFIQIRMARPAGQAKAADPQQAMMNTMMNFMPLMVVIFGWNFASGPVLYWFVGAVYSCVQQWFITGWGQFGEWVPGLPELPEHRRLGYRPPRDLDDVVVESGASPGRFQEWMNKKMEQSIAVSQARADAKQGSGSANGASRNGSTKSKGKSSLQAKVDEEEATAADIPAPRKSKPAAGKPKAQVEAEPVEEADEESTTPRWSSGGSDSNVKRPKFKSSRNGSGETTAR